MNCDEYEYSGGLKGGVWVLGYPGAYAPYPGYIDGAREAGAAGGNEP
jgi:hypothetical protein